MNKETEIVKMYSKIWTTKKWQNLSQFCNGRTHPSEFLYRRYRRGINRCLICGAKKGKVQCVYRSLKENMVDNLFTPSKLFEILKTQNSIKKEV